MYPTEELRKLAAYKIALQRKSARRRTQCADAATKLSQPLKWIDEARGFFHRISPLVSAATVPLGLFAVGKFFPKIRLLRTALRWSPIVFTAAHQARSFFNRRGQGN